jgi:cell division protein FtsB
MMASMLKRRIRPVLAPVIGASLFAYFSYHAIQGDRGILARFGLEQEIAQAEATLAELRARRAHLEHRASLINPEQVDLDMLDERARAMLNYAEPGEVVLFFAAQPGTPAAE